MGKVAIAYDESRKPPPKPEAGSSIWVDMSSWDESKIPLRPWIAKGYLLRKSVSMICGVGAGGKSMLSLGYGVALAMGVPWGRFTPMQVCKVSIYNPEDDQEEQERRLSAVIRQHAVIPDDLDGKIARIGPTSVGTLLEFDPYTAAVVSTPAMLDLLDHLEAFKPDVLFLDPLVELHSAQENDNTALRSVVAFFRKIAVDHNMAVCLIHHSRKGPQSPGDADTIRGAGAIVGAVRVAMTVCTMSPEESSELGLSDLTRHSYFRVDGAKSNYAAIREAEWYEKVEYELDNGEFVTAAVPWEPPSSGPPSLGSLASLVVAITRGCNGQPWSPKLSDEPRSIRALFNAHDIAGTLAQKAALRALIEDHGVSEGIFWNNGNPAKGLKTDDGPSVKWKGNK